MFHVGRSTPTTPNFGPRIAIKRTTRLLSNNYGVPFALPSVGPGVGDGVVGDGVATGARVGGNVRAGVVGAGVGSNVGRDLTNIVPSAAVLVP